MHVYSILQAVDVFLMCVILALIAALSLTNALHVWESMVLRIRKERANWPKCAAMIRLRTLAIVLLGSCLSLCLHCHLLLWCVVIFLLEIISLVTPNRIDANPQSSL